MQNDEFETDHSGIIHQDEWMHHAIDQVKRENAFHLDDAVDKAFAELKQMTAFGLFVFVLVVLIWLLWTLKNLLRIDLFPGKDFRLMEDIDELLKD
jgi:hypothetical protein